jgi:hypothetical protein
MDSLKNIVSDIRIFLYGGIQKLPLTIAGTLLLIGLFTANYAILFFLLGFLVLAPFLTLVLNPTLGALILYLFPSAFRVKTSDVCKIVVPFLRVGNSNTQKEEDIVFSVWSAMIFFSIGYLFTNGLELYGRESVDVGLKVDTSMASDIQRKTNARKSQAIISMASILLFGLVIFGYRFYSGCENMFGLLLTAGVFGYVGYNWYKLLASVGQDRLSDLFGIANRLLPPSAIQNKPIACLPIPN